MIHGENNLTFTLNKEQQHYYATVTVPSTYIDALYKEALLAQKAEAQTYGFCKGTTPLHYIEHNFRPNILEHLKELLFTHCVMNFLCQALYKSKLVIPGEPALTDITLKPLTAAHFIFRFTSLLLDGVDRWKKLSLKAPDRKHYKDLDKQVESFIKEEAAHQENYTIDTIQDGDWVCFDLSIVDKEKRPLLGDYKDQLWVKMNEEEADKDLHDLFIDKRVGDSFFSESNFLQNYISNEFNMNYTFLIAIKEVIPHAYFCFDYFKRHFHLKTVKDMHLKLIEVFSYRNDLSQRRETVEATFKLLLKHYFIPIPQSLLERQRQIVLNTVYVNPDYHVYKAQNDFKEKIRLLAEKQIKEAIITDTIAYQENIQVTHSDIITYLNLIKRPRTKEFVYFGIPSTKIKGLEIPLSTENLKQYCLREKTLNHIIYNLTKKNRH
jgi:FKBP-type peptidyl-prolyl cis-trans isomerase (trigger factor)